MTDDNTDSGGALTEHSGASRRSFLRTAGAVAGTSLVGSSQAGALAPQGPKKNTAPDSTLVVGPDSYPTIADAWAAAVSGDVIYVHSSYDARQAGELFPVVLDYSEKEVTLTGGHPSGSVIDASHSDRNVIEVLGRGMNDFRNNPVVQNLKIVGGRTGLYVRAAPYSSYQNLVFHENSRHGVHVDGYVDPDSGRSKGTYGAQFLDCQAWSCGGSGFRLETAATPHATRFVGCLVTWCGGNGSSSPHSAVVLRGFSSQWAFGIVQGNAGFGMDIREGASQGVRSSYFEGNGRLRSYPTDIYAVQTSQTVVENCYFTGHFASGGPFVGGGPATQGYRAVTFHNGQGGAVRDCTFRNYTDAFVRLQGGTHEVDINCASHYSLDGGRVFSRGNSVRIRDAGVIVEDDLHHADNQGQFVGDRGIHDGSGGSAWGPCIWDGGQWINTLTGVSL